MIKPEDIISAMENYLEVKDIDKSFGELKILSGINVTAGSGKLTTLIGPSGCGKSTLLRIISGLETMGRGNVFLGGRDISSIPPERRGISMVFQHYSLFPSMSVSENIAYGLKVKKWDREKIKKRTEEMLEMVNLQGFGHRKPEELSGGEMQRVAIARSIAPEPSLLLMDEPLSNLDVVLRKNLRNEIRRIQKETGITIVFVTHDMEEAMEISDYLYIMNKGRILSEGTPRDIYDNPSDLFSMNFSGSSVILKDELMEKITCEYSVENGSLKPLHQKESLSSVTFAVRPERIIPDLKGYLKGTIADVIFSGDIVRLKVKTYGQEIEMRVLNDGRDSLKKGDELNFSINPEDIRCFHEKEKI